MKHYYKAKEFVLNQLKERGKDASYSISNHVINTAYYSLKHDLNEEEFNEYLDKIAEKTHRKLFNCGCQCFIYTPLEKKITEYEGGGDWVESAKRKFKGAVKDYYNDLYLYNEKEDEDGK